MSANINLKTNSQYVSSNMFKNPLVGLNSVKRVFPLNLPRANSSYLFAFLDSHVIHYPTRTLISLLSLTGIIIYEDNFYPTLLQNHMTYFKEEYFLTNE